MYRSLLADARFQELLLAFDRDLAATARKVRCARCGGALHSGNFLRKPRGGPAGLGAEHNLRFSFCCAVEDCRKRVTPSSFRFLGRKVFLGAVVTLVSAIRKGVAASVRELSILVGASRNTIQRWRRWWRDVFAASSFWRVAAVAFMPPVAREELPTALLDRFSGVASERVTALLRLLLPISGGAAPMLAA